jgi:hypothetical protein
VAHEGLIGRRICEPRPLGGPLEHPQSDSRYLRDSIEKIGLKRADLDGAGFPTKNPSKNPTKLPSKPVADPRTTAGQAKTPTGRGFRPATPQRPPVPDLKAHRSEDYRWASTGARNASGHAQPGGPKKSTAG